MRLSNFWNFFSAIQIISCRDWWPWTNPGYITMTQRQSYNQWSGGVVAHPAPTQKFPSAKICWKSSCLDVLGSKQHPSHWLSSKGPKYQHGVLLISTGAIEGHFQAAWRSPRGSCSCTMPPAHRAPATQKKLAYLGFQCLDHPPYSPDLTPSDYHLFPGLKKQLKGHHFSFYAEVIAAAEICLDGNSEFFWVVCKS